MDGIINHTKSRFSRSAKLADLFKPPRGYTYCNGTKCIFGSMITHRPTVLHVPWSWRHPPPGPTDADEPRGTSNTGGQRKSGESQCRARVAPRLIVCGEGMHTATVGCNMGELSFRSLSASPALPSYALPRHVCLDMSTSSHLHKCRIIDPRGR